MKGLTQKQKNIIEFINEFMTTQEMAPTIYEIAEHFHIKTSTVFAHIRALQKKNYLTRSSKARSISLSHPKKRSRFPAGVQSIPFHCIGEASAAETDERGVVVEPPDRVTVFGGLSANVRRNDAVVDEIRRLGDIAREVEQERHHEFGDGGGVAAEVVADDHAPFHRLVEVDDRLHAATAADDDLELLRGVEDFGVDRVVFADEDVDVGDSTLEFVARHHDMVDGIAGEVEIDPVGEMLEHGADEFRRDECFAFHGMSILAKEGCGGKSAETQVKFRRLLQRNREVDFRGKESVGRRG